MCVILLINLLVRKAVDCCDLFCWLFWWGFCRLPGTADTYKALFSFLVMVFDTNTREGTPPAGLKHARQKHLLLLFKNCETCLFRWCLLSSARFVLQSLLKAAVANLALRAVVWVRNSTGCPKHYLFLMTVIAGETLQWLLFKPSCGDVLVFFCMTPCYTGSDRV